ncbi:MAG: hypothetical protein JSV17_14535 [Candidatus Aminicenantes bacterium]|nr:MAG: hypothetical protein JSV17_14535 [Candidatus Aminicenantes bacterium]
MMEWLEGLPLVLGKYIATLFFIGMIFWAWLRPHNFIFEGAPDKSRWRDLRIWATVFLGIQVVLYIVF